MCSSTTRRNGRSQGNAKAVRNSRTTARAAKAAVEALEIRQMLSASPVLHPFVTDTDDQISEAHAITVGSTVSNNISSSTDVDVFKFTGSANEVVNIRATRTSGTLDTFLRLFNSSGTEIAHDDDSGGSNNSFISAFQLPAAGTYYVGVSSFQDGAPPSYNIVNGLGDANSGTDSGNYTLQVQQTDAPNENPSNNSPGTATNLGTLSNNPTTVTNTVSSLDLDDFYRVHVPAGANIQLHLNNLNGDANLDLETTGGTVLASSHNGGTNSEAISFFTAGGGDFIVRVFRTNRNAAQKGTVRYTLSAAALVTDTDPDDQISQARTNLSLNGGPVTDAISVSGDVDLYRVNLTAGVTYGFDVDRIPGSSLDSFLRIFNSSGTEITHNDDGPTPGEPSSLESYIEFTPSVSGTYFIGVSGFPNETYNAVTGTGDSTTSSTGGYRLWGTVINGVDTDDQLLEARTVAIGSTTFDSLSNGSDVDVYSITVAAGQTVAFDTDSIGTDTDTVIRLFDNTGTQIAFNDDGQGPGESGAPLNSYLVHTFSQAGTYYLGVSGFSNSAYNVITGLGDTTTGRTGSYQLAVRFNA